MSSAAPKRKAPVAPASVADGKKTAKKRVAAPSLPTPALPRGEDGGEDEDEKRQKRLFRNRLSAHQHREKQRLYKLELEEYNKGVLAENDALKELLRRVVSSCGCGVLGGHTELGLCVCEVLAKAKTLPPLPPPTGRGHKRGKDEEACPHDSSPAEGDMSSVEQGTHTPLPQVSPPFPIKQEPLPHNTPATESDCDEFDSLDFGDFLDIPRGGTAAAPWLDDNIAALFEDEAGIPSPPPSPPTPSHHSPHFPKGPLLFALLLCVCLFAAPGLTGGPSSLSFPGPSSLSFTSPSTEAVLTKHSGGRGLLSVSEDVLYLPPPANVSEPAALALVTAAKEAKAAKGTAVSLLDTITPSALLAGLQARANAALLSLVASVSGPVPVPVSGGGHMRSSTPPLAANASFFMSTGGVGALSEALHTQPTPWPRDNFAGALAKGQTPYLLLIVPAATVEGVEGVASGWAGQEHTPADEHAWVEIGCTISTVRRVNTLELALTA